MTTTSSAEQKPIREKHSLNCEHFAKTMPTVQWLWLRYGDTIILPVILVNISCRLTPAWWAYNGGRDYDEAGYKSNPFCSTFSQKYKLKKLADIGPFCGATDIPVFDFWWRVPWVSKPAWIPLLTCLVAWMQRNPQIHLWCNTCSFRHYIDHMVPVNVNFNVS